MRNFEIVVLRTPYEAVVAYGRGRRRVRVYEPFEISDSVGASPLSQPVTARRCAATPTY